MLWKIKQKFIKKPTIYIGDMTDDECELFAEKIDNRNRLRYKKTVEQVDGIEQITFESLVPYISIVSHISKEAVETLKGEYIVKNSVPYGLFFIKVEPTDELVLKAVKLYEALAGENPWSPFVIEGELLDRLLNSTESGLKVRT